MNNGKGRQGTGKEVMGGGHDMSLRHGTWPSVLPQTTSDISKEESHSLSLNKVVSHSLTFRTQKEMCGQR